MLENVQKAHEDAIQSIIYSATHDKIYSGGLDKSLKEWSLQAQSQSSMNIFSNVNEEETPFSISIVENPIETRTVNQLTGNRLSNNGNSTNDLGFQILTLKKIKEYVCPRVNEMILPEENDSCVYIFSVAKKSIDRFHIEEEKFEDLFIQETQEIMTFCLNRKGTLLVTSLIGLVPCFHLWMVDSSTFFANVTLSSPIRLNPSISTSGTFNFYIFFNFLSLLKQEYEYIR